MNRLPATCPICDGEIVVQSFHCRSCDATVQGRFHPGALSEFEEAQLPVLRRFARLNPEQLGLLETFVRCEGRLNRMQEEVGLSYPTLRGRLDEIVRDLGFTPPEERVDRAAVLAELASGSISAEEAARRLRGSD